MRWSPRILSQQHFPMTSASSDPKILQRFYWHLPSGESIVEQRFQSSYRWLVRHAIQTERQMSKNSPCFRRSGSEPVRLHRSPKQRDVRGEVRLCQWRFNRRNGFPAHGFCRCSHGFFCGVTPVIVCSQVIGFTICAVV